MNIKGGLKDEHKVGKLFGCFKSPLVNDWISVNCTHLHTLTFEACMTEFWQCWLPQDWKEDLTTSILSSCLDPKASTFEDWAVQMQTLNVALWGTDQYINDNQMQCHLDTNMDSTL